MQAVRDFVSGLAVFLKMCIIILVQRFLREKVSVG